MRKKIILVLIVGTIVFHAVWYGASKLYQNKKIPDRETAQMQLAKYMKEMNITADLKIMENVFIDANGFKLHLTVLPVSKKAPTLVFVPGTSVYAQFYIEYMYAMFRQGFNVVGLDPRGHGESSGPRGDYSINDLVDDTLAVVGYARKRFGGRVALAGSSQGGMVAFYAAARDNSISAAVCHNISDLNGRDNLVLSQIRPPVFMVPMSVFMANLYKGYSIPISLYLDLKKELMKDGTDVITYSATDPLLVRFITLRALGSMTRTDLAKPVEKITVPIMLIHADRDSIFPQSYVEGIYNRLTCKKNYLLIKNTDHLVMTNNVPYVAPRTAAWLKGIMH